MRVRELEGGNVIWAARGHTLRQAAVEMTATGVVGSVAVEVDGALEGILTERDTLRAVAVDGDLDREPVSRWMSEYPDSFTPGMEVAEAANWMLAGGYRHLPVVEGGVVLGVTSIKDVRFAITESPGPDNG